jgi:hypothetical protein
MWNYQRFKQVLDQAREVRFEMEAMSSASYQQKWGLVGNVSDARDHAVKLHNALAKLEHDFELAEISNRIAFQ